MSEPLVRTFFKDKTKPRKLEKVEQTKQRANYYLAQRRIALKRDKRHCRICGTHLGPLETHHVERRSATGTKQKVHSDHHTNLLTVCAGLRTHGLSCHTELTSHVMYAYADQENGTNGKVLVTRYNEREGGQTVFKKAA
jgi:hypothetical protein